MQRLILREQIDDRDVRRVELPSLEPTPSAIFVAMLREYQRWNEKELKWT